MDPQKAESVGKRGIAQGASVSPFWSQAADELLQQLRCSREGLTAGEAKRRLAEYGPNRPKSPERHPLLKLLAQQFRSPIILLLTVSAILSAFTGETTDALIILAILLGSVGLSFWQERSSVRAVAELAAMIQLRSTVRRDGRLLEVTVDELVPGDIVELKTGDLIPADCRLLETQWLNTDEAAITGEAFPAAKSTEPCLAGASLADRTCAVFQGTHVSSGKGSALVVNTGEKTIFGQLAHDVGSKTESSFEHGVRRFGYLLLEITVVLILVIFAINVALKRPVMDVFMFSLALAVGLTPQLLPAIVSVTLSQGARNMARKQVLVRRLVAIEDFGGMSILCTDKTGTLTEGTVQVREALDAQGHESNIVRRLAYINAKLQAGFDNPIDVAIASEKDIDAAGVTAIDEVPYDFVRRRLSMLVQDGSNRQLITKGASREILEICTTALTAQGPVDFSPLRPAVEAMVQDAAQRGLRALAIACKDMPQVSKAAIADESNMVFAGLILLADTPKQGIQETLQRLTSLGLRIKMVTGDNRLVAASIAAEVGLPVSAVATGSDIEHLTEPGLRILVQKADIFAEIDPNQKERIIRALRNAGLTVGYLGDGINDVAALQAANVGISVDTAVDVTREAADIVLLRKDLNVLADGIVEGRRSFANTLKYIYITTSASFGNMFSMAGASLLTAFLPMLPKQILLLNLLSDLPAMTIATDRLDPELVAQPRRWDMRSIRNFMLVFGLISSAFDYLTFAVLLRGHLPVEQFRSAWFIESMLTEVLLLLVVRTRRPFYRSFPSRQLMLASVGVGLLSLAMPYLPFSKELGFAPLSLAWMGITLGIAASLLLASEVAKRMVPRAWMLQ